MIKLSKSLFSEYYSFNPEEPTKLTFLEAEEEGDGTEAKRSKSFSRALLVLLLVMEQATGASEKKD